jgi:hypothetical protein
MKWINVKEKLPVHCQIVLAYSPLLDNDKSFSSGMIVARFTIMKEVHKYLKKLEIEPQSSNQGFDFSSQERSGMVLNGVTHWMPLPENPK